MKHVSFFLSVLVWFIVRILPDNHKVFHYAVVTQELLRGKLGLLAVSDNDRAVMDLEASDALWLSCRSHSVHCLSNLE